jgi:hypothetical protein
MVKYKINDNIKPRELDCFEVLEFQSNTLIQIKLCFIKSMDFMKSIVCI